jgi:imidazole glycerol-phosphate synthase subunit HisH
MSDIGIINCGMGNLTSVKNAFKSAGHDCDLVDMASELKNYKKLVLPGVGAFNSMMRKLHDQGFSSEILEHIRSAKPFMGICLGMQVLFETSNEFEETPGLSVLKGKVQRLPTGTNPVPNVGWWDVDGDYNAFSSELSEADTFYFVHSYICHPCEAYCTLTIDFNDHRSVIAVRNENIFAYQFHPEKSQVSGQKLLRSFIEVT